MTDDDRTLLEKAAKAAGIEVHHWLPGRHGFAIANGPYHGSRWNPLENDGDALRLAVKLGMQLDLRDPATRVFCALSGAIDEHHRRDPYAATRRAIVRAAAALSEKLLK